MPLRTHLTLISNAYKHLLFCLIQKGSVCEMDQTKYKTFASKRRKKKERLNRLDNPARTYASSYLPWGWGRSQKQPNVCVAAVSLTLTLRLKRTKRKHERSPRFTFTFELPTESMGCHNEIPNEFDLRNHTKTLAETNKMIDTQMLKRQMLKR